MIGSTNAQRSETIYSAGAGIDIDTQTKTVSIDTNYPSQNNIIVGANTLNQDILSNMQKLLPIIIDGRVMTFYEYDSHTPSLVIYSAIDQDGIYLLDTNGNYAFVEKIVATIHR